MTCGCKYAIIQFFDAIIFVMQCSCVSYPLVYGWLEGKLWWPVLVNFLSVTYWISKKFLRYFQLPSFFRTILVLQLPYYFHDTSILFHSTMCNVFVCVMAVADHVDCLAPTTFNKRKQEVIASWRSQFMLPDPPLIDYKHHATRVWYSSRHQGHQFLAVMSYF